MNVKIQIALLLSVVLSVSASGQTPCTLSLDTLYVDTATSTCNSLQFKYQYSGGAPVKYYWNYGDGNSCTCIKPKNFYTANGSFQVCGRIEDANGCADSICITVDIQCNDPCQLSKIGIHSVDTLSYSCSEIEFITITSENTRYVRWEFGDGDTSDSKYIIHDYRQNGTYSVRLIVRDSISCADTAELDISIDCERQEDSCEFRINRIDTVTGPLCRDKSFFIRSSSNAVNISWDFGDGYFAYNQNGTSHTYQDTGLYRVCVMASDSLGCADTFCLDIRVECDFNTGLHPPLSGNAGIYPNPAGAWCILTVPVKTQYKLYDVRFKKVIECSVLPGSHQINLENCPPGVYILILQTVQGTQAIRLIRS